MSWLQIALAVLPLIQKIVKMVEGFSQYTGAQKKDAALQILEAVWDPFAANAGIKEIKNVQFSAIQPLVSSLIDTIVTAYNLFGTFTHAAAPAPTK